MRLWTSFNYANSSQRGGCCTVLRQPKILYLAAESNYFAEMVRQPHKKQKREEFKQAVGEDGTAAMPKKKFYRQRAHANPFSDHALA